MSARAIYVETHNTPSPTNAVVQQARLPVFDSAVVEAINQLAAAVTGGKLQTPVRPYVGNYMVSHPANGYYNDSISLSIPSASGINLYADLVRFGFVSSTITIKPFSLTASIRIAPTDTRITATTATFQVGSSWYPKYYQFFDVGTVVPATVTIRTAVAAAQGISVPLPASVSVTFRIVESVHP